ncbi:MAG: YceD family protein [Thioalkalispiraceae bacterium]|jgi:uncharacterized protein
MTKQGNLPLKIDPIRLAETGREFSGRLAIRHMHRLKPLLLSEDGEVQLELKFGVDEVGTRYLQGHLTTNLVLECQRCLDKMTFPVDKEMCLAFVRSEYEAEQLPEEYDPHIVEQTPVALVDLIEDELILSLPQVPMHEREDCLASKMLEPETAPAATDELKQEKNPFEVLATLKDSE